ncbi:hypothetical protein NQ314_001542 [Rhamnusium bicolor]|uniref:Uncharacterized protein n=1 Tax=Rhamnusium bicolor TaxID=1586634 RepID=A0AAV8ZRN1_9CUCU|nr:hypothetical protein NQ314_001542 [Rhamnusium bicolor]
MFYVFKQFGLKKKVSQKITLDLVTHKEGCKLITKIDNKSISVKRLEKVVLSQYHLKLDCLVTFDPKEECYVDYEIIFTCTCDSTASCSLFVKASADNSTFVSYQSLFTSKASMYSEKVVSTFPYFPKSSNNSFYARRIRVIQTTLEKWLFSQGFFFKNFYKIPYGLSSFPVDIQQKSAKAKKNNRKTALVLPLMQLLVNLKLSYSKPLLGETAVNEIVLKNRGSNTMSYTAIFFSNDINVFQLESKVITIPPKKEKSLKIIYQAKNILKKTAVLVLSGETPGYKFCKSMAVTLIGIPSIFNFTNEYEIKVDTYQKN